MAIDNEKLNGSRVPNPIRPRSYTNPDDVYDDVVGFDAPHEYFQPGYFRAMWRVRPVAIQQNRITTVQSQAGTGTSVNVAQVYRQGVVSGPSTTSTTLTLVPDMSVSLQTNGAVQVGFQITADTAAANDNASLAIFRDNVQISPTFFASTGGGSALMTISQTIVDNPLPGAHVYAVYWAAGSSKLSGVGKSRSIWAINLKPV